LDRIDLHVEVPPVRFEELDAAVPAPTSAEVAARVAEARARQRRRLEGLGVRTNAAIPPAALREAAAPTAAAWALLGRAVERLGLSARAAHRALRVARTAADLAGRAAVGEEEVAEAVGYRAGGGP
ncbi:MAG: hypothetical protein R3263_06340, partial [Myxococcota bacterium]|nr:hypothetical protein [Myxococcota bacterium]